MGTIRAMNTALEEGSLFMRAYYYQERSEKVWGEWQKPFPPHFLLFD